MRTAALCSLPPSIRPGIFAAFVMLSLVDVPALGAHDDAPAPPEQAGFSGTLMDSTGRAWGDTPLTLVDSATGEKHEVRTDAAGRFSVSQLVAGEYRAEVSKPGFAPVAARVVLQAGEQLRRDVVPQVGRLRQIYNISPPTNRDALAQPTPQRISARVAAPDDPCARINMAGCITPPMRMVDARPVFPRVRQEQGVSGTVDITARLGTDGYLKDLQASEGADPEFAAAAIAAMRLWEYSVLLLNGIPQECSITVTFRFNAGSE